MDITRIPKEFRRFPKELLGNPQGLPVNPLEAPLGISLGFLKLPEDLAWVSWELHWGLLDDSVGYSQSASWYSHSIPIVFPDYSHGVTRFFIV